MESAAVLIAAPGDGADRGTDSNPSPRYSIVMSTDAAEIEAAQRLRYQAFADEMGAPLPHAVPGPLTGEMIDLDKLDPFCDHLLAREEGSGRIVGCLRLLPPAGYRAAGGTFTDSMFDASALEPLRPKLVELGRVVVAPEHRNGAVMGMLWAAILRYQKMTGHQYIMGCLSVQMEDGGPRGALVRAVYDFAKDFMTQEYQVTPRNPVSVNGLSLEEIPPATKPKIPPLMRAYTRLGALICGPPSYDVDFDMSDFLVLLSKDGVTERYLERLEGSLAFL
ncbi:GNAT family N-acetyltransferase [Mycobacterium sp. CBMA271]|uniref:GNAT family N-acetyltransferase n=1 Tax=unclassified Mycobacteroides TaxID=2618759 RepID=UPI0012DF2CF2|nr:MULTISPECIES: GNAT family N-acyltransferase [unclassified Mycobacteroides]MUM18340.1 ornithine-acyl-ACP acyltransferase [Mycobacteroides sp. CBMA 326]MUM22547.1 GNAT family N-acetyltransferase [Mycobacteroides sp. CBMA 271]